MNAFKFTYLGTAPHSRYTVRRARVHAERYHQRNTHADDFAVRLTVCDPSHNWNGQRFSYACELTAPEADALVRKLNRDGLPGTWVFQWTAPDETDGCNDPSNWPDHPDADEGNAR